MPARDNAGGAPSLTIDVEKIEMRKQLQQLSPVQLYMHASFVVCSICLVNVLVFPISKGVLQRHASGCEVWLCGYGSLSN